MRIVSNKETVYVTTWALSIDEESFVTRTESASDRPSIQVAQVSTIPEQNGHYMWAVSPLTCSAACFVGIAKMGFAPSVEDALAEADEALRKEPFVRYVRRTIVNPKRKSEEYSGVRVNPSKISQIKAS